LQVADFCRALHLGKHPRIILVGRCLKVEKKSGSSSSDLIKLSKIDTISTKCGLLFGLLDQHLLIRLLNAHGHSDGSGGLAFYIHNIKIHQIYHYHRPKIK
jgi:hypothetical protein